MNSSIKLFILAIVFISMCNCQEITNQEALEEYKNDIKMSIMSKAMPAIDTILNDQEDSHKLKSAKMDKVTNFVQTKRVISGPDDPSKFFHSGYNRNISNLPTSGRSTVRPWSGTYWPAKSGGIAARYNNNAKSTMGYSRGNQFISYTYSQAVARYSQPSEHNYYSRTNTFENYVNENYSPAEKYDLLVGDYSYGLTNYVKNYPKKFMYSNGDVASWMGICHGWCPASYEENKPQRPVTLLAADGKTRITFLPDDVKALATQFWAQADYTTNFIGQVCDKYPGSSNTLLTSSKCFSVNPGTFAITVANQIGIKGKVMIFDPQTDPEIWNQPAFAFSTQYFNPISNSNGNVAYSKITLGQANSSGNSFLRFAASMASPGTAYLVGAQTSLEYATETNPVHSATALGDKSKVAQYRYVIELDSNDNILGGEWMNNTHPNFIWKADERYAVKGAPEDTLQSFGGASYNISGLGNMAKRVSARGQVIESIMKYLVANSS